MSESGAVGICFSFKFLQFYECYNIVCLLKLTKYNISNCTTQPEERLMYTDQA